MKTNIIIVIVLAVLPTLFSCNSTSTKKIVEDADSTFNSSDSYVDSIARADSMAVADSIAKDNAIIEFITDMYNNGKYNDDEFLETHCSSKMLNILTEAFEYDCEGGDCYAGWIFRSMNQDGPNERTEIISVKPLGEHWYKYDFYDMGNRADNTIKVIKENGKFIIDDIR